MAPPSPPPTVVIQPGGRVRLPRTGELWHYRDLFWLLVRREILAKYRQTVLGPLHAVIQPLLGMVVFSVFFGGVAQVPSDDIPYPLFYYAALVPWTYFSGVLTTSSTSLAMNAFVLKRVYFPRMLLPIVPALSRGVGLLASLGLLLIMMLGYGIWPSPQLLWLPLLIAVAGLTAVAAGTWLAAINITYRDVGFAVGLLAQLWMIASPVIYPLSMVPEPYRGWYTLNPMVVVIEGFRAALAGGPPIDPQLLATGALMAVVALVTGAVYFSSVEHRFADVA